MKINKKERVTEKAPRNESKNTFDTNEEPKSVVKRKTVNHVEKLASALHGKDPYCASHKN